MAYVKVKSLDGPDFDALEFLPEHGGGPGLILIHGIFGLSQAMQQKCMRFASLGYVTLCPNLFWRQNVTTGLDDVTGDANWDQARKLYTNFDVEAGVRDLLASLAYLRKRPKCSGHVGALGFCLGSRLSFLLAARADIDCAVGYYGVGLDSMMDEIFDVRTPYLLHLAGRDKLIPELMRGKLIKALDKNSFITTHIYPAAEHGFARLEAPTYHKESCDLADQRTVDFLSTHLR
jgi:carboxymethylenebutenolidase